MPRVTATPSDFDARTLLDCVDDVIIVVDDEFRFTYANSAARAFLGSSLVATAEDAGMDSLDVVHPDDVQHVAERFAEIVADENGRGTLRLRVREGDGWRPRQRDRPGRREACDHREADECLLHVSPLSLRPTLLPRCPRSQ